MGFNVYIFFIKTLSEIREEFVFQSLGVMMLELSREILTETL